MQKCKKTQICVTSRQSVKRLDHSTRLLSKLAQGENHFQYSDSTQDTKHTQKHPPVSANPNKHPLILPAYQNTEILVTVRLFPSNTT
jgi:hypothetical protein